MAIEPTSNLIIASGVPFNSSYKDVYLLTSETQRYNYILSLAKFPVVNDFTYIRSSASHPICVPFNIEALRDCNYLMYQNSGYGEKWFFAFITSMEYQNDGASLIYFEQDIFFTWCSQFEFMQSFVEREHVNDDTIGANTVPENLELGPYKVTSQHDFLAGDLNIYIMVTDKNDLPFWNGPGVVGGFPVPCYWVSLGSQSAFALETLQTILDGYAAAGKSDAIVAIFTCPSNLVSTETLPRFSKDSLAERALTITPKNNKLYTFPYCALTIQIGGQSNEFRYERFGDVPAVSIDSGFGPNMVSAVFPLNYEGQNVNWKYQMSLGGWPLLPWVRNYFQNWLAQNKINLAMSAVNTISSVGGAIATGGLTSGQAMSTLSGAASAVSQVYQAKITPNSLKGSADAADINAVMGFNTIHSYCNAIYPEYARIIDDYFSRFGYKVNRLKTPNTTGRANWNFVKTIGSTVRGKAPQDACRKMEELLDAGITFWHTSDIGNYSLNNSIV